MFLGFPHFGHQNVKLEFKLHHRWKTHIQDFSMVLMF